MRTLSSNPAIPFVRIYPTHADMNKSMCKTLYYGSICTSKRLENSFINTVQLEQSWYTAEWSTLAVGKAMRDISKHLYSGIS